MSTAIGNKAEEAAAKHLKAKGYKIISRNWRRPKCEIDIVASMKTTKNPFNKDRVIHFVEVKYRKGDEQGSGLDYITPGKLNQMKFAAQIWINENAWNGSYELSAVEVAGEKLEISEFIEQIVI